MPRKIRKALKFGLIVLVAISVPAFAFAWPFMFVWNCAVQCLGPLSFAGSFGMVVALAFGFVVWKGSTG